MTSLHLHIGQRQSRICARLDLNQCCQKTGKRFLTTYNEHVHNRIPRPYVLAVTQDEQNEIRCFDGLGFSLARGKEDPTKKINYKQIYYVCLKNLQNIRLIEYAPEDTALAYAPFAYATILSKKVSAARQKLIDHYLLVNDHAKVLELLQLNIEEFGEYVRDIKILLLAAKMLSSGSAGVGKDEALSTEYLSMALRIDPSNAEAKGLLAQMRTPSPISPQSTSSQPLPPEFASPQSTSSQSLPPEPISPLPENDDSLKTPSPCLESLLEPERAQSCPPAGVGKGPAATTDDLHKDETSSAGQISKPSALKRSQSAPPLSSSH